MDRAMGCFKGLFTFGKIKNRKVKYVLESRKERQAAVRIQTAFRCFLARKELRALRSLVKLQAVVRGFLVRKQVSETRRGGSTESNALSDTIIPPSPAESGRLPQIMVDILPNSNGGTTLQQGNGSVKEAISRQPNSGNGDLDEKARGPVVQQKGCFKVTSENLDIEKVNSSPMLQKSHSMQVISQHQRAPLAPPSIDAALPTTQHGTSIFPMLLSILHANIIQRGIMTAAIYHYQRM